MYNHSYPKWVPLHSSKLLFPCLQAGLLCLAFTLYAIYESLFADLSLYLISLKCVKGTVHILFQSVCINEALCSCFQKPIGISLGLLPSSFISRFYSRDKYCYFCNYIMFCQFIGVITIVMSVTVVVPINAYSACGICVIFLVSSLFSHPIEGNFQLRMYVSVLPKLWCLNAFCIPVLPDTMLYYHLANFSLF